MKDKLIRFGVSMEEGLLKEYDKIIKKKSYKNRSEALRDLVRHFLVEEKLSKDNKDSIGVITLVYNHHQRDLDSKLNEIQHNKASRILSSLHIHLDYHNCLQVIVITGRSREIRELSDELISEKGVLHGTISFTNANPE